MKAKKKQNRVSIEEYIETYCQEKRIRKRFAVYVSPQTHHNLRTVARMFASEHYTTASSLADSIISHHFEEYTELLNNAYEENSREIRAWLTDRTQDSSEESDAHPEEENEA